MLAENDRTSENLISLFEVLRDGIGKSNNQREGWIEKMRGTRVVPNSRLSSEQEASNTNTPIHESFTDVMQDDTVAEFAANN